MHGSAVPCGVGTLRPCHSRAYLRCAVHIYGGEVVTFVQQPSQQDGQSSSHLVPLLEQVTQHRWGQGQSDGGVYLAEGKLCRERGEGKQ